ncbi:hypothetical protein SN31241_40530 [Salmonella enterica subsp. enterica serovar Newport str. USMARC-S3124.1]|nr:hypothetical protein SN31241_40530 [Salmonella enterica subsp. enterica serovar Newport str. USMARC-S3124.1]
MRFIPAGAGNTWRVSIARCRTAVYPRWRGEHFPFSEFFCRQHGLSPLARGTH